MLPLAPGIVPLVPPRVLFPFENTRIVGVAVWAAFAAELTPEP